MSSWGTKRRNTVIVIFTVAILILIVAYSYAYLNKEPTCFDGKQNQGEDGIDCGGSCEKLCPGQAVDPIVHWVRYFEVVPGIYNIVAYVENLNTAAGADKLDYVFKLYGDDNVVLSERTGSVKVRPKETIPIIEGTLNTGRLTAIRATFNITNEINWERRQIGERAVAVRSERLFEVDNLPRISAVLENISVRTIKNITAVVIVYDTDSNAMAASRTVVNTMASDQTVDLVYTWPQRFPRSVSRFEIIPLYDSP